jgi:2-polyprenyl-6-methoxyphenol hydroxylase-like FAD-dependent oxidoreductase
MQHQLRQQADGDLSHNVTAAATAAAPPLANRDFRVAIVGGGMCGISLAVVLVKSGIEADLFESHSTFGEMGASVSLGANAVRALSLMGLLDPICASTKQTPGPNRMQFTLNTEEGEENLYSEVSSPFSGAPLSCRHSHCK